jgi:hypothetical protein
MDFVAMLKRVPRFSSYTLPKYEFQTVLNYNHTRHVSLSEYLNCLVRPCQIEKIDSIVE